MNGGTNEHGLTISVIMPAFNASGLLTQVLPPLVEMLRAGEVCEVLLVDDCSTDDTVERARELGASVLEMPRNGGPGAARNLAAQKAAGDILWFVDSDVVAWAGGAKKIREAFEDPTVDAVFGSYDETPSGTPWISRYKNLVHRYYHQRGNREASTFWAGCGAVRKSAFLSAGGFDVVRYTMPSIEDIELGYRLRDRGGRILLLPDLLAKHLKVWTFGNVIHTDIFRRAIPWSRLMIANRSVTDDLNTSRDERVRAVMAAALLICLLIVPFVPGIWPLVVAALVAVFVLNRSFFLFMLQNGGRRFAMTAVLFHQLYYFYSSAAFVFCLAEAAIMGRKTQSDPG
ncbi:MAG: glycosyltransferase [Paracoccaceae bacterium]